MIQETERQNLIALIRANGPLSGLEIKQLLEIDSLALWRTCKTTQQLQAPILGKRYLRFDRHVEGLARLSPSILREFFTYTVVGLANEPADLSVKCGQISRRICEISKYKLELAARIISEIMTEFDQNEPAGRSICFVIAGDIVHEMAHDVPRPERSTGRLVKGSDIDLVVIADDNVPEESLKRLDRLLLEKKHRMLINPAINEELDYKVKTLNTVREQSRFDTLAHMIAIKILHEGILLYGDKNLFQQIKTIIHQNGLTQKLDAFEKSAGLHRMQAEQAIIAGNVSEEQVKAAHLFYSAEEFEEFE